MRKLLPAIAAAFVCVAAILFVAGNIVFAARPLYYTREITDADLKGRSLRELSLMRNTIYARAGNPFRKKWLHDYFSAQGWYRPLDKMDVKKLSQMDLRNADLIANHDAMLTEPELMAMKNRLGEPRTPEDRIELRLLSIRLGEWLDGDDPERTPLEDPRMLDKQLTLEHLQDFSRRDLRILRNMIYARHGRPFHSVLLKQYFGTMKWYKPDPGYTEARLTPIDNRNITLIRGLEDQLGGPLTDIANMQEDGWFVNA